MFKLAYLEHIHTFLIAAFVWIVLLYIILLPFGDDPPLGVNRIHMQTFLLHLQRLVHSPVSEPSGRGLFYWGFSAFGDHSLLNLAVVSQIQRFLVAAKLLIYDINVLDEHLLVVAVAPVDSVVDLMQILEFIEVVRVLRRVGVVPFLFERRENLLLFRRVDVS